MVANMLIRCGEPSKYDHSPYGTICKSVKMVDDKFEIYVQISDDDSSPIWEKVGIFYCDEQEHIIQDEIKRVLNGRKVNAV